MRELLERALADPERGIAEPPAIDDDGARRCSPSAPAATRAPRSARSSGRSRPRAPPARPIDLAAAEDALQRKAVIYDKEGDRHYDYISAWIKSMRGSDPDASVYYLAAMLEGGEDPRFIARRMVILASEDIGNADPQALAVATAAAHAVDRVGLPECALNLAQAAVYLALAPKSNASTIAISRGRWPRSASTAPKLPPDYLRDAHYPGAKELGRGQGYRYAHDEPGADLRPAAAAARGAGRALLRADRPRVRGRARRSASTPPGGVEANEGQRPPPVVGERLGPLATEGRRRPHKSSTQARRADTVRPPRR